LVDFGELNPASPIQLLVESLNAKKNLPVDILPTIIRNLSEYMQGLTIDNLSSNTWALTVQGIETLFRRIVLVLASLDEAEHLLDIMVSCLKIPGISKVCLSIYCLCAQLLSSSISGCFGSIFQGFELFHPEFEFEVQSFA
jgi:hypothetical protein